MNGTVTKKDAWQVFKFFGFKKAVKLLLSKEKVALLILVS